MNLNPTVPDSRPTAASWPSDLALRLIALLAGLYAAGVGALLLGQPLSPLSAAIGLLVGWLGFRLLTGSSGRAVFTAVPLVLLVCLGASTLLYDGSSDAYLYHKPAVLQLLAGWNPYREATPSDGLAYWTVAYPKAAWICGAQLASLTGRLESAKAINLIALLAAGGTAWMFLTTCLRLRPWIAAFGAALVALNPVTTAQSTSFYVDGLLASLFTILVLHLALLVRGTPAPASWFMIASTTVLLANLKFTGLVYAGGALAWAGLWLAWRQGVPYAVRYSVRAALVLAAAVLLFGKAPYVDNLLGGRHLFHPLLGHDKIPGFMDAFRPDLIRDHDRFARFALIQFARERHDGTLQPRWPFQLGLVSPYQPDLRAGGFGPWYGEALGLALLAGLLVLLNRRWPLRASGSFLLGALILSGFCQEDAWWARYSPQLFLLAPLAALFLFAKPDSLRRWLGGALILMLVVNAMVVSVNVLGRSAWISYQLAQDIAGMRHASASGPVEVNIAPSHPFVRTLRERQIAFSCLPGAETRNWNWHPFYSTGTIFWRSVPRSPP